MSASDLPPAASPPRARPDWRGWLALSWAVAWGSAYAVTAFHARAPQVIGWLRRMLGMAFPR